MVRYEGTEIGTVNVLVYLKSRLLGEALTGLIEREMDCHAVRSINELDSGGSFSPHLILTEAECLSRDLFTRWPDGKVILLDTGLSEEDTVHLMHAYKLYGIITREDDVTHVRKAFRVILDGQIWLDNARLKAVLHGKETPAGHVIGRLSDKETRIIELVTEGYKNREIASKLFLSEQTIKSHLGRIFRKMHVTSRSQLVSITLRNKNQTRLNR